MKKNSKDISIVLCGGAGQGIETVEHILTHVLKLAGFHVFAAKEFMSRIRGGSNSTTIRVSAQRVRAFVDRVDILIPFDKNAIEHVQKRISPDTLILSEAEVSHQNSIQVPFTTIAKEIGNIIYANIVGVGLICGIFKVPRETIHDYLKVFFARKGTEMVQKNIVAANKGYDIGVNLRESKRVFTDMQPEPGLKNEVLMDGSEAVALGAIAGGCNFIAAYPMTPSTGVFTFLEHHAREFEIIAEQAEDEISAMNMAIGAWYAGGRAMVTTSGGGFDLMTEGLSLAGMQETPMVIHLGQRPGPSTGLPTRTEQADLELALYAGHGEFPRIILAPGKPEDAFHLTQRAFNLADKYQVPVFILTDQFFVDSYYNIPAIALSDLKIEKYFIETDPGYKRYQLTENGISPRGIPGYGTGMVNADCHVHDEQGHISEDLDLRTKMVNKFLSKMDLIKQDTIPPELVGNKDYTSLVLCWGSNYNVVNEALSQLSRSDTAFLHFKQVYPLASETAEFLKRAKRLIIVENNATAQFGKLIRLQTGIDIERRILKYSGIPFSVEEVVSELENYPS